jgi:4-diphosphocytidyl-2-C-methyl-D-erythritol kinase
MSITEFAPAKINLALHVLGRRSDGYHDLDSVVAFASVGDALQLAMSDHTTLSVDGPFAADVPVTADNLVLKAYAALASEFPLPPVAFRLTKDLPVASGIGGGSADAAAALRGLVRLADLRVEPALLKRIALSLGADVPVCLHGAACRMQGVGDVITPLSALPAQSIVLVNPLKACSTADVFRKLALKPGDRFGDTLDVNRPAIWRNDMIAAAISVLPEIKTVLDALAVESPQSTVRMSGSGATCFALFDNLAAAKSVKEKLSAAQPAWWIEAADLS